jgi:uncharacterized protein (TIGR02588 family)
MADDAKRDRARDSRSSGKKAESSESAKRSSEDENDDPHEPDWLERTATIVSALLVAALLALLLWDATREHAPAELTATAGKDHPVGMQHYLAVSVENAGDRAARDVEVSVSLTAADSTDEATFVIDWIPGKSTRHGTAIFPRDPASGKVTATVKGFAEP